MVICMLFKSIPLVLTKKKKFRSKFLPAILLYLGKRYGGNIEKCHDKLKPGILLCEAANK